MSGFAFSAGTVSCAPFMIALAPRGRRVSYTTALKAVLAPAGMLAVPAVGPLLPTVGYTVLFLVMGATYACSVLLLIHSDPRSEEQDES